MDIVLFTLNGIIVYLLADWLLRQIETRRGAAIKNRQLVFFVIFLPLIMLSFQLMRVFLSA